MATVSAGAATVSAGAAMVSVVVAMVSVGAAMVSVVVAMVSVGVVTVTAGAESSSAFHFSGEARATVGEWVAAAAVGGLLLSAIVSCQQAAVAGVDDCVHPLWAHAVVESVIASPHHGPACRDLDRPSLA